MLHCGLSLFSIQLCTLDQISFRVTLIILKPCTKFMVSAALQDKRSVLSIYLSIYPSPIGRVIGILASLSGIQTLETIADAKNPQSCLDVSD